MARPRRDGTPAALPRKHKLSDVYIKTLKPSAAAFTVWDTKQRGLALTVQPTGRKAFKCIYAFHGRPRWYHIGDAVGLADARKLASRIMFQVAEDKDPQGERIASRGAGTFEALAAKYCEWARTTGTPKHGPNKSWRQADALVRKHLLPRWAKLRPADIQRSHVKTMKAAIKAPIVANQTLAAASAIFAWAIREEIVPAPNPCTLVDRNATNERDRVLSDTEVPKFWAAFDDAGLVESAALKMILLTGQRPGEVAAMRREHIADGWWTLPGEMVPALKWPGTKTKQTHRVWLPASALALLAEMDGTGQVFAGPRGKAVVRLDGAMRDICKALRVERATPHDLRRTHGTKITALGFGRDAMNRIQNHKEGGIADVYDRHEYAEENKKIMEAVAARILTLVEGKPADNVVQGVFGR